MASSVRRRLGCITPAFQLGDFDLDFVFEDFFSLVLILFFGCLISQGPEAQNFRKRYFR